MENDRLEMIYYHMSKAIMHLGDNESACQIHLCKAFNEIVNERPIDPEDFRIRMEHLEREDI